MRRPQPNGATASSYRLYSVVDPTGVLGDLRRHPSPLPPSRATSPQNTFERGPTTQTAVLWHRHVAVSRLFMTSPPACARVGSEEFLRQASCANQLAAQIATRVWGVGFHPVAVPHQFVRGGHGVASGFRVGYLTSGDAVVSVLPGVPPPRANAELVVVPVGWSKATSVPSSASNH